MRPRSAILRVACRRRRERILRRPIQLLGCRMRGVDGVVRWKRLKGHCMLYDIGNESGLRLCRDLCYGAVCMCLCGMRSVGDTSGELAAGEPLTSLWTETITR